MLARIDHRSPRAVEQRHCAIALARLQERFHQLLRRTKILRVGVKDAQSQIRRFIPLNILEIEVEKELRLFAAFFQVGNLFKDLRCLREVALRRINASFYDKRGEIAGLQLQYLSRELFAFRLVATRERPLAGGYVCLDGLAVLAHRLIEVSQANLDA